MTITPAQAAEWCLSDNLALKIVGPLLPSSIPSQNASLNLPGKVLELISILVLSEVTRVNQGNLGARIRTLYSASVQASGVNSEHSLLCDKGGIPSSFFGLALPGTPKIPRPDWGSFDYTS